MAPVVAELLSGAGEGSRENREGEGATKDRYWSTI